MRPNIRIEPLGTAAATNVGAHRPAQPLHNKPIATPAGLAVRHHRLTGWGLYTTVDRQEGEHIIDFQGVLVPLKEATPHALQIDRDLFLQTAADPNNLMYDDYINHSCDPNCITVFKNHQVSLVARRAIAAGQELTFNYNSTEWDLMEQERYMRQPCIFRCACGAAACAGTIMGFRFLTIEQKIALRDLLSPYLRSKLKAELRRVE
jgi:hypothetical protein